MLTMPKFILFILVFLFNITSIWPSSCNKENNIPNILKYDLSMTKISVIPAKK